MEGLSSNVCPICSKGVEILNDDFYFSMDLHMKSHKPLETINQEIDEQCKKEQFQSKNRNRVNNNLYLELQNNEQIFNYNVNSTNKGHMSNYVETGQKSASSSWRGKTSKKKAKYAPQSKSQSVSNSLLEEMFNSISSESKLHKGFFSENNNGLVFCTICNVTVQPVIKVTEHINTKLHEHNTIQFLTSLLPVELHHVMEFVIFYCSSLCCGLCGFKMYTCSTNPNETILSITLHNLSKGHLERNSSNQSKCATNEGSIILNYLAEINPLISNNQHFLDIKMKPEFRCRLCNMVIGQSTNDEILNRLFNDHFLSITHLKTLAYSELAAQKNKSDTGGKERHNFEMVVEPKLQELISHVNHSPHGGLSHSTKIMDKQQPNTSQASLEVNSPTTSCIKTTNKKTLPRKDAQKNTTEIPNLLSALPEPLRNTSCIVKKGTDQIICSICNIKIPHSSSFNLLLVNLETHLLGKEHKKKTKSTKPTSKTNLKDNLAEQIPVSTNKENLFMQHASKEEFHCKVCNINVPSHNNFLERHLKDVRHMKLALIELSKTEKAIENAIEYITIKNGNYACEICNKFINHNTKNILQSVYNHISGENHKTCVRKVNALLLIKLKSSEPIINANFQFLKIYLENVNEIHCTLCSSDILGSCKEDIFKKNILSHLTESGHKVHVNKIKCDSNILENETSSTSRSLVQSFKDDIPYIKFASSENLLECTLCKYTIGYNCLREHLEGKNHNQMKALKIESLSHSKTIERHTSVRNIGSLLLLLGNNRKLSTDKRKTLN